jgi:hypothetical protein
VAEASYSEGGGRLFPSELTRGPWDPGAPHGCDIQQEVERVRREAENAPTAADQRAAVSARCAATIA